MCVYTHMSTYMNRQIYAGMTASADADAHHDADANHASNQWCITSCASTLRTWRISIKHMHRITSYHASCIIERCITTCHASRPPPACASTASPLASTRASSRRPPAAVSSETHPSASSAFLAAGFLR